MAAGRVVGIWATEGKENPPFTYSPLNDLGNQMSILATLYII
jgi:hypothetical protein